MWTAAPPDTGTSTKNSFRLPRALNALKRLTRVGSGKKNTQGESSRVETANMESLPAIEGSKTVADSDMNTIPARTSSPKSLQQHEPSVSPTSAEYSRRSTGSVYSRASIGSALEEQPRRGGGRECGMCGSGDDVADMSLGNTSGGGDSDDSLAPATSQRASVGDVQVSLDRALIAEERRDVYPDELQPRRPSRRGSVESRAHSAPRNSEGRVSSEGRPSGSRNSWEMRDSYSSYGRPSWEQPSLDESRVTEEASRMTPTTRSEEWNHVFQGNAANGVVSGEARASKASEHSFYSRSSAEVSFEVVLSSALYSEQADLPCMSPLSRRASANDACRSGSSSDFPPGERPFNSHELRRPIKSVDKSPQSKNGFTTPQGYVDSLSLEEEAAAIVAPATKMAIATDGIKYRNLARCASDRHAHHRQRATDAQLARLAFNLPSVRDVDHHRCRTEFRGGVMPQ